MCLKWFKKHNNSDAVEIDADSLESWIKRVIPTTTIETFDRLYRLPPFDEVIQFLELDLTDRGMYKSEFKDCDDFAIILWGLWKAKYGEQYTGFGLVLTDTPQGAHAANIFVDNEYDIWLIEPQNDRIFLLEDKTDWSPYTVIF